MTEPAVRLLVVVLVLVAAWLVAQAWRRGARQGTIRPGPFGPGPAVLVFTSASCGDCVPVLQMVAAAAGTLVREVRFEDQPDLFDEAGVGAVPLTVVVAADGRVIEQFAGMPPRKRLARAVEQLGE